MKFIVTCISIPLIMIAVFNVRVVHAISIETVIVGNPGNPADTRYLDVNPHLLEAPGSVSYPFRMGKTEVTNTQYVAFLNAVAALDTYGLYNPLMSSDSRGGINRTGAPGNFEYSIKPPAVGKGIEGNDYQYDDKPAVFVSWFDAIRFANWLHNGQGGPGSTEDGSYTLIGGTAIPLNANTIARNANARWVLPNEHEWYKAAYYDPAAIAYYEWPTGSNTYPDNNVPSADSGNSANFFARFPIAKLTTGDPEYPLTDVGAYTTSASRYGTFDQGGNVYEWTESLYTGIYRVIRGGSWGGGPADYLHASSVLVGVPASETNYVGELGFRVAHVPEPSTWLLAILSTLGLSRRRR